MKLKLLLILSVCLLTTAVFAQSKYAIKGAATDTENMIKLGFTTVTVVNAKDSVLVNFTLASDNGSFAINNLPAGKFILMVTYPEYADYVEQFTLDAEHPLHDFGNINLRLKSKILQDVIIKGDPRALKIKGDTTEFNAAAYVTQPNARVEDLLKQLPGIQVDKDGKITANGEAVNKVLVDGEEFFGDDPTLVTKNIRADMVDKVQLYDKKSDQAAFTGIDDGQRTKTINIKLKEDKKNGAFGKLAGSVGTDNYYESQLQFNRFWGKSKFSLYGILANDGKTGLSFDDSNKLGASGGNVVVGDDGSISIYFNNTDDLDTYDGNYSGKGLPMARAGGVHYDGKSADDKQTINFNYKIGSIEVKGVTTNTSEQKVPGFTPQSPGTVFDNNSSQTFDNYSFRHKADLAWTIKLDTSTTLKLTTDGTVKKFNVDNTTIGQSVKNDTLVNNSNRHVTNSGTNDIFNVSALFTKKFKKPRRTFSWNISQNVTHNETDGFLISTINYFHRGTGALDSVQNTNQHKTVNTTSTALNSNITYTEPLSKPLSLSLNYGFAINDSHSDKKSFNQSAPGVYNVIDTTYTNSYRFNQLTDQLGATLNFKKGIANFNAGLKASDVSFSQTNELKGTVLTRNFINWLPAINGSLRFSQQKSLNISYSGSTAQPTIDQIQPVPTNNDPLNIVVGNPNLKPAFNNRFQLFFNSYKVLTGTSLFVGAFGTFTSNQIVNNTTLDTLTDKTTTRYVNLTGHTPANFNVYFNFGRKIKPIDVQVGFNGNISDNVSYSYINGLINQSISTSYQPELSISKYEEKKYDFNVSAGPTFNINRFSVTPQNNNNAPGFNVRYNFELYLPAKFFISSDMRYTYLGATQTLAASYLTILNGSINKTFFKQDNLKLSLAVNNLLNQNTNFSRNVNYNTITQSTTTGILRYFMFTVSWDFTKFATGAAAPATKQ